MSEAPPYPAAPGREFRVREGHLELCLRLMPQGRDLHAFLLGGEWHVGATALAAPGETTQISQRAAHREGALAARVACRLAEALACAVSVSAGIHFATITRAEIAIVERMTDAIVDEYLSSLITTSSET